MSFPSYLEYKDSGIEWLGRVPEHWQIKALRYLSVCLDGKRIPLNGEQRADKQGDIPYWGANAIMDYVDEAIFDEELLLVGEDGAPFLDPLKPVAFHSSGPVWPNNHIHVLRPNKREWVRFLVYAMNAADYANYIEGSTRQKLNQSRLMGMPVSWPGYTEQTQIARFLDHETARIDALIEEQQRLIELLKETRQAVISHAVTKGLDPTVPMKDSGVEWLGEVPAHWTVRKVSVDFLASKGPRAALLTKEYCHENAGEYPVYSGQTENGGILGEIADFDIDLGAEGAILSTTVGAKAMSVMHISGRISLSQNCMIIRPFSTPVKVRFFFYHFQPLFSLERRMIPDHMQPSFRMEDLYSFRVAVPPVSEQNQIAEYLDTAVNRFDELIGEGDNGIALLQERRSALISAAVTGKIDVRGWQPPASSTSPELAQEAV